MAIRKNRRMQKGGGLDFWNWFGSKTEKEQASEGPGQASAGPGQASAGPGQASAGLQVSPTRTLMGGKFRGGKSNRRNKSKKSRRTRRR